MFLSKEWKIKSPTWIFRLFCLALLSLGGLLDTLDFLTTISITATFLLVGGFPLSLIFTGLSTFLQLEDATVAGMPWEDWLSQCHNSFNLYSFH
jgi:hypothetical protein